jgi:hypothetical protein
VPDEFAMHARGSIRETLLAIRSLIDSGIQRIDREERERTARRVKVE